MGLKQEKLNLLSTRVNYAVWKDCGPSAALVYGYIRGWIIYNEKKGYNQHFCTTWMYQTQQEICDALQNVITIRSVENAINALVKEKYLLRAHLNPKSGDRTSWYALGRDPDLPFSRNPPPKSAEMVAHYWKVKTAKEKAHNEHRQTYIDELMAADYTDTAAGQVIYTQYGHGYCFADLSEEDQYMVVSDFVDFMMKRKKSPTPEIFSMREWQEIYAERYSYLC